MEAQPNFDLKQFEQSILEICFAFINSPTKGISILECMLLYKGNNMMFNNLLKSLQSKIEKESVEEKRKTLNNLINNLEFIKSYLLNEEACYIIREMRENMLKEIANNVLGDQIV